MIEFIEMTKEFQVGTTVVTALNNINLTIQKGDVFGVIGFSGAGKSTLIRTVNLLEEPTFGRVLVNGKELTTLSKKQLREEKKNIGMIFQHFNLLRSKTVFENVAMPLVLSGVKKSNIEGQVREVLSFVGLQDKAERYIDELSGGQKQRVGIARALVTKPAILLCDEATSALDPQTTKSILELLKRVNIEYGITILMITHEMEVIRDICNRVAVMENGRVIETGNVLEIFSAPQEETTKNFVQSVVRDDIPQSVYEQLKTINQSKKIYNLKFIGVDVRQPVISQVAKKFDVDVNVLFGNITELQGIPFGNLIVELVGSHKEIEKAHQFISTKDIQIEEVVAHEGELANHYRRSARYAVHG
ncbi:ATP-binding cassette domain-containing protein [Lysinibacillus sphaericus]|uniref:ATP-binding cassette domain-containing protein n=1 Tax=Lysinibacillus sphaericus TaxID=1421 RepID=A0A544UID2_LYSSH|nr:ATP-binding cassette domain-containing protein [Lysinibacillus sp. SDF0037]TQR32782.1 ATP-binding cassette domain-containing protein [Lysinibacillus sp. SDF0037]